MDCIIIIMTLYDIVAPQFVTSSEERDLVQRGIWCSGDGCGVFERA